MCHERYRSNMNNEHVGAISTACAKPLTKVEGWELQKNVAAQCKGLSGFNNFQQSLDHSSAETLITTTRVPIGTPLTIRDAAKARRKRAYRRAITCFGARSSLRQV